MDAGSWAPIVVDIATVPFEPRPPRPNNFRPDIICDGWSNAHFTVRLASVRGYAHRYAGVCRQDAVEARCHPRTGAVVFAVADGVASAPLADIGAHMACELAIVGLLQRLDREPEDLDCFEILDEVAATMCDRLGGEPAELAATYGTTLVAGAVLPGPGGPYGTVVRAGDSAAWLLRERRFTPVVATKAARQSTVVNSSVDALPDRFDAIAPVGFDIAPDAVLLVGTDGFGDPLGDGGGLVGQLFADVLSEVPPALAFAHALDFSRETFDDDRTLVAIWPSQRRS
jgi:hypothetical protein